MTACIEARGLRKAYRSTVALDGIDLRVEEGRILGLIGPNGAGKTTVFNLITGFLAPDAGEVRFDGRDITGERPDVLSRAGIARTFQILRPFPRLTVEENVMVGPIARGESMAAARERAARCLELVGISHKAGDLARGLSTGQRKRLEMARAMATSPRLLLLDEITGGVDQPSIPGLIALAGKLHDEGVTLLVIEHNMRVIMELAEKVVFLHLGEKLVEGPPQEIARHPKVVELYLGSGHA